ncbi:MAG: hypothetical protein VYB80_00170, partial [Actinomycetota bacterium]|nr:hypothetical protein [Actinomycetota bacterium]
RPCIFLSGDKDPFGSPTMFNQNIKQIKGNVSMTWLRDQGHDPKKQLDLLITSLKEWVGSLR